MSELLKAIRKARQGRVEIGKHTFIVRRPTDVEVSQLGRDAQTWEVAQKFVVGWENVKALDIEPSTKMDDEVAFDHEVWAEWCADRPDFWTPITNKVMELYRKHSERLESSAKN